jgi:hypothetical protein
MKEIWCLRHPDPNKIPHYIITDFCPGPEWIKVDERNDQRKQQLEELFATAYQVVGAAGGPVELLDNLYAATNGDELPHSPDAGLPWVPAYGVATDADIDFIKSMISSRIFTDEYTEKLNNILKIISK